MWSWLMAAVKSRGSDQGMDSYGTVVSTLRVVGLNLWRLPLQGLY
jgi:hypothetical protein